MTEEKEPVTAEAIMSRVDRARQFQRRRRAQALGMLAATQAAVSGSLDRGLRPRGAEQAQQQVEKDRFKTFSALWSDEFIQDDDRTCYDAQGAGEHPYIKRQLGHRHKVETSLIKYASIDEDGVFENELYLNEAADLILQHFPDVTSCLSVGPRSHHELNYLQTYVIDVACEGQNHHEGTTRPVMGIELFTTDPSRIREGDAHVIDECYDASRGEQFDLIFASHVLEHLVNPFAHFASAARVARRGYYIIPNMATEDGPTFGHPLYFHWATETEFGADRVQEFLDEVSPGTRCVGAHVVLNSTGWTKPAVVREFHDTGSASQRYLELHFAVEYGHAQ